VSARGDDSKAGRPDAANGRAYDDVGAGVTAILQAAEEAADNIRADARKQAADLIHEAEEAVAARLQALTRDAEKLRSDAEAEARDMRLAVEGYGTKRRRDADEEANRLLAEAEARAREIVDGAEERVRESNRAVAERGEALQAEVRSLELKRQKAVDALRRIVAHLEDALDGQPADREPPVRPEPVRERPELAEDLGAAARRPRRRLAR
jgi:cell division septum initiation protein DivIVA